MLLTRPRDAAHADSETGEVRRGDACAVPGLDDEGLWRMTVRNHREGTQ
jgi:hypothetical protein